MSTEELEQRVKRAFTSVERDARYQAIAEEIYGKPSWQTIAIIVMLLKEAGWEPVMDTPDGWKQNRP